jgi:hypothetical protein
VYGGTTTTRSRLDPVVDPPASARGRSGVGLTAWVALPLALRPLSWVLSLHLTGYVICSVPWLLLGFAPRPGRRHRAGTSTRRRST